jgi:8-oxo-dGTP pyrophosphatase MutT (NUDIX family)
MIEAAGGVVLRGRGDGLEVLVVHRVRYRDWSLPKGKLHPGEEAAAAALREVEEETGVRCALGPELPAVTYPVQGDTKHVRWFLMTAESGDPVHREPDREVDDARWVPVREAPDVLTYDQDVASLRRALHGGAI